MAIPSISSTVITADTKEILKEGSYLIYEFKDNTILAIDDDGEVITDSLGNTYEKSVSPLFSVHVINEETNQETLDILLGEIPYYHLESTLGRTSVDEDLISQHRDCGINDIPYPLQTNFWGVLTREAWGSINNDMILEVYNKLRFPFLNENIYINAERFPELALSSFTYSSNDEALIQFKYEDEDNTEDIANGDRGCVDYLEEIVNEKIEGTYALLNYNPEQATLLYDWAYSEYWAGKLSESEMEREKSIFKLQDLKYELLRRKFAGSTTLYNLTISSIGRTGTFVGVIPAGRMNNVYTVFRDKRYIRIVNIPGILSTFIDLSDLDPISAFYSVPYEEDENYIPLKTVTPLFYTSATQESSSGSEYVWDAENFYLYFSSDINSRYIIPDYTWDGDSITGDEYQNYYLRDNNTTISWDALEGIISEESINTFYPKLDEMPDEVNYRTLDGDYTYSDGSTTEMRLDIEVPYFSMSSVVGAFLDLSANKLLYHRNTLQKEWGDNYPFLTYPIANDNSVSLMDVQWIEYLQKATESKSRVSDQVYFGAQVNRYAKYTDPQTSEYSFFTISYSNEEIVSFTNTSTTTALEDFLSWEEYNAIYDTPPKYAYIWYITLNIDIFSYTVSNMEVVLISKICLRVTEDRYADVIENLKSIRGEDYTFDAFVEDYNYSETFTELLSTNLGILPLTYELLQDNTLAGYVFGLRNVDGDYTFFDTYEDLGYSKAYYMFSDSDLSFKSLTGDHGSTIYSDPYLGMSPSDPNYYFSLDPDSTTKTVYFGIQRYGTIYQTQQTTVNGQTVEEIVYDDNGDPIEVTVPEYYWSEPIRIINLDKTELLSMLTDSVAVAPDWMEMVYQLNPYLNFTAKSASGLRNQTVIPSAEFNEMDLTEDIQEEVLIGPSEYAGLSNVARARGYDFTCFDDGLIETHDSTKPYGFYLYRERSENLSRLNREYLKLYGDNRDEDYMDDSATEYLQDRSNIYYDVNNIACLRFERGSHNEAASPSYTDIGVNHLELRPFNPDLYEVTDTTISNDNASYELSDVKSNWVWNESSSGISVFANIGFNSLNIEGTAEASTDDGGSTYTVNLDTLTLETRRIIVERKNYDPDVVGSEFSLYQQIDYDGENLSIKFVFEAYPSGKSGQVLYVESDPYEIEPIAYEFDGAWDASLTLHPVLVRGYNPILLNCGEEDVLNNEPGEDGHVETLGYPIRLAATWINVEGDNSNTVTLILLVDNEEYTVQYSISSTGEVTSDDRDTITLDSFNHGTPNTFLNPSIPGYPPKYNAADSNNQLEWINVGSRVVDGVQYESFLGNIYDLRLYNTSLDSVTLKFLEAGTMREQFSYAPSTYKLAYSIYRDYGVFKLVKGSGTSVSSIPEISTIRLFDRSIWDSILVDMYPVSADEMDATQPQYLESYTDPLTDRDVYDSDGNLLALSVSLAEDSEVTNNAGIVNTISDEGLNVSYRGNTYRIEQGDYATIITTSIYPVYYKNHLFSSEVDLQATVEDDHVTITALDEFGTVSGIELPVQPSGDTLKYSTELSLNFEIAAESDLSEYYSKGSKIRQEYSEVLGRSTVVLDTDAGTTSASYSSNSNHILIPLTIPDQEGVGLGLSNQGYFDRFYLKGVKLASEITTFLKATNYYTELRLPIAITEDLSSAPTYINRWDAIRGLKEGTYYITCKYPFEILPFLDNEFNLMNSKNFAVIYGSIRFKIEVKGTPIEYDEEKWALDYYPTKYSSTNIANTLSSLDSTVVPEDNRTFPHRQIDIDMYVLESDDFAVGLGYDYEWRWEKIYSNWDESVTLLTEELLEESNLTLDTPIPLFFSKNYTSPFFIAKYDGDTGGFDPTSADDDLIEPIMILPTVSDTSLDLEALTIKNESNLDSLKLVGGKSYKLLFDYNGKITELSFTDSYFDNDVIDSSELLEYTRMTSLINNTTSSEASLTRDFYYSGDSTWYSNTTEAAITSRTSGFDTTDGAWKDLMVSAYDDDGNLNEVSYFGNPYSRASKYNYLLRKFSSYRDNIDNLAFFPYVCREAIDDSSGRERSSMVVSSVYKTKVGAITAGSVKTYKEVTIDEAKACRSIWSTIKGRVLTAISSLVNKPAGILTALSIIYPNISYETPQGVSSEEWTWNRSHIVNADDYSLIGYSASDRSITSRNDNIIITRRGCYSNNLIKYRNFEDSAHWSKSQAGKFVSDLTWDDGVGKDVYMFSYINDPILLRYRTNNSSISSAYETAICIGCRGFSTLRSDGAIVKNSDYDNLTLQDKVTVYAHYIKDDEVTATIELTDRSYLKGPTGITGYNYEVEELEDAEEVTWYVYSAESDDLIEADSVQFEFVVDAEAIVLDSTEGAEGYKVELLVTKPVVRKTSSLSHILGLSDVLKKSSTSDSYSKVATVSHHIVYFLNNDTEQPLPIQFKNKTMSRDTQSTANSVASEVTHYSESGQSRVIEFIRNCSLGKPTENSKTEVLFKPWTRRMIYWVARETGDNEIIENAVVFYGYRVDTDYLGVKSQVLYKIPTYDIFVCGEDGVTYDSGSNQIVVNEITLLMNDGYLAGYNTNLQIYTADPVEFIDERFTCIANCFNPTKFKNNESNPVAVTNIQLLSAATESSSAEVIFEFEYLPVIYDELDQHISVNIMIHKDN